MQVIKKPKILIPKNVNFEKWATIACDQFCARPKYWKELEETIADSPSTYKITFPEICLSMKNIDEKIKSVWAEMDSYLKHDLFKEVNNLILVEREVENGKKRLGLMVCINLDMYNWERVRIPIRATENTLLERLPVRIKIRSKAEVELPHAIVLIDNPEKNIIEPIYAKRNSLKCLYDFNLNMGGGNIKGYEVNNSNEVIAQIHALLDPSTQKAKYKHDAGILLAVGDGNHSIATAKLHWENLKKTLSEKEQKDHPAKYMLVELINLYGEGMDFKPIHRIVYNPDDKYVEGLKQALKGNGKIKIIYKGKEEYIAAPEKASFAIQAVQKYIDAQIKLRPEIEVEYVHNDDHLMEAIEDFKGDSLGIVMPEFPRDELLGFVLEEGNLPKKAFSIGEPEHKRYYLEARKIVK